MPGRSPSADVLTGYDLVLTPNIRSARQLETACSPGKTVNVLPWHAWTASLWQDLILAGVEDRVLLNDAQASSLWEQVLADIGPSVLRPVRSMVELCVGAHRLLCGYGALPRLLDYAGEIESDAGAFAGWLQEYERRCRRERWVAPAALELHAASTLADANLEGYRGLRCLLYGFDPLRPDQESLLQALQKAGASIDRLPAVAPEADREQSAAPALLSYAEIDVELHNLALFLETDLRKGVRNISVILPNSAAVRGRLERELRTCISSEERTYPIPQARTLWEFSEGVALSSLPLVRDALALLDWLVEPQSPDSVSQILRSPYFHLQVGLEEAAELDGRALRDRERIRPEWSIPSLAWAMERRAPELAEVLRALQNHAPATQARRRYSDWTEFVCSTLKLAGWPGARERTSYEFQTVDRWNDLLDQVTSLDAVARPVAYAEFCRSLKHLSGVTLFSPQNTGAPIQIMSPSECEGSTAEVLRFALSTEAHWNGKRAPHPLLPFTLQKEFGMPGTDAIRDDAAAWATTQRIVQSAASTTFSYSAADKDGAVRPSTLVTRIAGLTRQTEQVHARERPTVALDDFVEDEALPELPATTVSGGVSILQHQAACAFRAFAERRLFSSELDTVDLGMEPRERGDTLHKALQFFWDRTRTQAELHRLMREGTLDAELQQAIDDALPQSYGEEAWTEAYLGIQRERLLKLMRSWMLYEAERPPFEVLHTEHKVEGVEVGPLRMSMRVDRIDRVDDAGRSATVLIDYKTGNPDGKGWLGDRPAEPQLPLYATAAGFENVQAIAFAAVKPGKKNLGLKTFPEKSRLLIPNAKEKDELAFEQQLPIWRDTLEQLAQDFVSGRADVGPKEYPATCQWCAQRMLCRLNPELLDELAEEDDDAEVTY